jgi:nucleoid-associated protein YgaU
VSGAVALAGAATAVSDGQPQKAQLRMYEAKSAKDGGECGSKLHTLTFQFNPKELTIAKAAKWERKTAKGAKTAGPPEFTGSEPCKLTVEMFFDAGPDQDGSVVTAVEALFACCIPTDASHAKKLDSPPLVVFSWGQVSAFPAFITSVSAKYTVFAANGTPIRATCAVAMEEMPGAQRPQNPSSGALVARRSHRLVAGDSLASLAYREYGDPALWRLLAEHNGIDDPLRLRVGSSVLLPALDVDGAGPA